MQNIFYLNLQITTNSIQIPYNIVQNLYKKRITSFYRDTVSIPPINTLVYYLISVTLTSSLVISSMTSKYWFNESIKTSNACSASDARTCLNLYLLTNSLKLNNVKLLSNPL